MTIYESNRVEGLDHEALKESGVSPTDGESGRTNGLCLNCEHRTRCTHPISESGVWHCEDYE